MNTAHPICPPLHLSQSENAIDSLTGLDSFPSLQSLNIASNRITQLVSVPPLAQLHTLDIRYHVPQPTGSHVLIFLKTSIYVHRANRLTDLAQLACLSRLSALEALDIDQVTDAEEAEEAKVTSEGEAKGDEDNAAKEADMALNRDSTRWTQHVLSHVQLTRLNGLPVFPSDRQAGRQLAAQRAEHLRAEAQAQAEAQAKAQAEAEAEAEVDDAEGADDS